MTNSHKDFVPSHPPLNREELARWLGERSDMLLRRIRGQVRNARANGLGGPHAASLLDEDDIFASVWRRVDEAAAHNRLSTGDSAMIWGYVRGVLRRVIQNRLRTGARDLRVYANLTPRERVELLATSEAELAAIAQLLQQSLSPEEWAAISLRARGGHSRELANRQPARGAAERKRWSRLLANLQRLLLPPPRKD